MSDIKLLSLDGGGIRGLSSLIILDHIMKQIASDKAKLTGRPLEVLKPCDYFDLIGGTSTGGIIAIMLGRLQMSTEECIKQYKRLAEDVFGKGKRPCYTYAYRPKYSSRSLREVMIRVIREKKFKESDLLCQISGDRCPTFVTTLPSTRPCNRHEPVLLRTYQTGDSRETTCTILDAAMATSAAPRYFKPSVIGDEQFIDAALGFKNPCEQVYHEANELYPGRELHSIICIGTGVPIVREYCTGRGFVKDWLSLLHVAKALVVDVEKAGNNVINILRTRYRTAGEGKYHRFDVVRGLEGISLDCWKGVPTITARTKEYLQDREVTRRITTLTGQERYFSLPTLFVDILNDSYKSSSCFEDTWQKMQEVYELIEKGFNMEVVGRAEEARQHYTDALTAQHADYTKNSMESLELFAESLSTKFRIARSYKESGFHLVADKMHAEVEEGYELYKLRTEDPKRFA